MPSENASNVPGVNGAREHPAETTGTLAGAIAALVVYFGGIDDPAIVVPLIVVIGAVPALVTSLVGLVRGRQGGSPPA